LVLFFFGATGICWALDWAACDDLYLSIDELMNDLDVNSMAFVSLGGNFGRSTGTCHGKYQQ
jgi:hypothetical protein